MWSAGGNRKSDVHRHDQRICTRITDTESRSSNPVDEAIDPELGVRPLRSGFLLDEWYNRWLDCRGQSKAKRHQYWEVHVSSERVQFCMKECFAWIFRGS